MLSKRHVTAKAHLNLFASSDKKDEKAIIPSKFRARAELEASILSQDPAYVEVEKFIKQRRTQEGNKTYFGLFGIKTFSQKDELAAAEALKNAIKKNVLELEAVNWEGLENKHTALVISDLKPIYEAHKTAVHEKYSHGPRVRA